MFEKLARDEQDSALASETASCTVGFWVYHLLYYHYRRIKWKRKWKIKWNLGEYRELMKTAPRVL